MPDDNDPRYEYKNEGVKKQLLEIGEKLKEAMPPGWGFVLNMVSFSPGGGGIFYVSNCNPKDTIEMLKGLIKKLEERGTDEKATRN